MDRLTEGFLGWGMVRANGVGLMGSGVLLWWQRGDREIMQRMRREGLEVREVRIPLKHSETRFSRISVAVYSWRQTSE